MLDLLQHTHTVVVDENRVLSTVSIHILTAAFSLKNDHYTIVQTPGTLTNGMHKTQEKYMKTKTETVSYKNRCGFLVGVCNKLHHRQRERARNRGITTR